MMTRTSLLLATALFVVAAACTGGGAEADDGVVSLSGVVDDEVIAIPQPGDEVEVPSQEEALLAFTACMRENGVNIEDPTVAADGSLEFRFRGAGPQDENFDREAARSAREACSELLGGVTLGFGPGDQTEIQDGLFEYAACMRENDYPMDDPDFSTLGTPGSGGGGQSAEGRFFGPFGEIDPEDPLFVAADEICGEILSGFGARFSGGGGPGRPGGGFGGGGNNG